MKPAHVLALTLLLVSSLVLTSCSKEAAPPSPGAMTLDGRAASDSAERSATPGASGRRLVKTVDLELSVDDGEATIARVKALVSSSGGYVDSLDVQRMGGLPYYQVSLRVPVGGLEDAVAALKQLADSVDREALRTEDVTDQLVDLEARLRTLGATEAELQSLLSESRARGQDVEDIMAVYRHLTEIRTQIERLKAQELHLAKRAAMSVINLALRPSEAAMPVVDESWRPLETIRESARALLDTLQVLADLAIYIIIVLLPVLLIIGLPLRYALRLRRQMRAKKHRAHEGEGQHERGQP